MNLNRWLILIFGILVGCANPSKNRNLQALKIIDQSIAAHGGYASYTNFENLGYKKTTYTYLEASQIADTLVQQVANNQLGHIRLRHQNDEGLYEIEEADEQLSVRLNRAVQHDSTLIDNAKSTIDGAQFVFFQPFKLKDSSVKLTLLADHNLALEDKQIQVKVVKATYPNSSDQWYFFFDKASDVLVANAVNYNGKMSLITNDSLQWHHGMLVHRFRTSYLSNEQFEPIRVQARYDYEMLAPY